MRIRPYKHEDYQDVLDIYAASKLDELKYEAESFDLIPLEKDNKRHSELMESSIYVYEDKGIYGFGAIYECEIRALFVKPDQRGLGIGKQILTFLISKMSGDAILYLAKSNVPARKLYESNGFFQSNEISKNYNGINVTVLQMTRNQTEQN